MGVLWYRQDAAAVRAGLERGERPDLATTMASGPLDELVALHDELGIFAILDGLQGERQRAGVPDRLLRRTLAILPFVAEASLSGAAGALFREPAILLRLGWAPVDLRAGTNGRHRHPVERQPESLPCHPDTLRDALRRVTTRAWAQAQRAGVQALFARRLVRGRVYAIDGSGLGADLRVVALVCVSGARPVIAAWRLLTGTASEKGKEAAVTQALVEQVLALGGRRAIALLLADALYADGPLLAGLKAEHGIDALVRLPADRCLYEELTRLAATAGIAWQTHHEVRTVRGRKDRWRVETADCAGLTSWDSFVAAAAKRGLAEATLWGGLIREAPAGEEPTETWGLVSTRPWPSGWAALTAYRGRWHIENDAYRELKEGWGLEAQRWGRDAAAARGRLTLTCLAFNTAQVYRSRAGERVAAMGIRRLRRESRPALGPAPVVLYLGGCYGVFPLEEVLALAGLPVRVSLLPTHGPDPPEPAAPPGRPLPAEYPT
jgi:hypothetical protein